MKPRLSAAPLALLALVLALSGRAAEATVAAPVTNALMEFGAVPVAGSTFAAGASALPGSSAVKAWSQASAGGAREAEVNLFRPLSSTVNPAGWGEGDKPWVVGDGTNFTQVIPIIPEPSTYGALFLAAASGVVLLHRRRRAKMAAP
jgi:hypothetical protein